MGPVNRPLDLEWLEDFVTLAKTGNFSRAAQARAIAQPAFSRHIRALEEWVGVDLVDRSTHPVELTAAGKRFLPLLQEVLAGLEAARIKARAASEEDRASLRLAVTHALALHFFPSWLAALEQRLRVGPVLTITDTYQACVDQMRQRRVQFVLCYGHPAVRGALDEAGFPMARVGRDTLIAVAAPATMPGSVTAGSVPLLTYSDSSSLAQILPAALPRAAELFARANIVFSAPNAVLLRTMALQGRGMAWLPAALVADDLQRGRLRSCGDDAWHVPLEIRLYRQRAPMIPVAESVWQLAAEENAAEPLAGAGP
ncbi:MAG: LysR substrate-binding domain-containing protein [Burkholderiaceae bacterium]|nr:LysR substrate-binding domain-containing protein [Burkholderiaceae bacterium]